MSVSMPTLPPGATRKRNVLDVLEALDAATDTDTTTKNVLIRVDFNVPMNEKGEITDDSRIRGALPTIRLVREHNNNSNSNNNANKTKYKVILMSHMGRPKLVQKGEDSSAANEQRQQLSLRPVAKHLSTLLNEPVAFADDCLTAQSVIDNDDSNNIVLLENLRFYAQEEKNDVVFSETLADYADAYINDAFGTCHRAHASTAGVPAAMQKKNGGNGAASSSLCGIGVLVASELAYLDFSTNNDSTAAVVAAIIGGSKVSTKLPVIEGLLNRVQILILGGGLAFTFLKAQGVAIGDSLCEDGMLETARTILQRAAENGTQIVLPVDAVCAAGFPKAGTTVETKTFDVTSGGGEGIPDGWMGLDVGPLTVAAVDAALGKATKVCFNGPMGVFEIPPFDVGTRGLVDSLDRVTASGDCVTVVGGGDSVAALKEFGKTDRVSYVSTGGGATLELLAGDKLPGVEAIADYE